MHLADTALRRKRESPQHQNHPAEGNRNFARVEWRSPLGQGLHWNSHHAGWLVQELSHLLNRGGHSVSVKGQLVRLNSAGITRAVQLFGRELQRMFSVRLATQMKRICHACT
jgi:hypothetical protein